MKLLLNEGISGLNFDETLAGLIQYPDDYRVMSGARKRAGNIEKEERHLASLQYSMVATYRGASNEQTANKLADVMKGVYGNLNRDKDWFRGAAVYQADDGEWRLHGE